MTTIPRLQIVTVVLLASAASLLVIGCATPGKSACTVVDLAKQACDVLPIRYLGPDGKVIEEEVPADELKLAVQRTRARRMGTPMPSGGAP